MNGTAGQARASGGGGGGQSRRARDEGGELLFVLRQGVAPVWCSGRARRGTGCGGCCCGRCSFAIGLVGERDEAAEFFHAGARAGLGALEVVLQDGGSGLGLELVVAHHGVDGAHVVDHPLVLVEVAGGVGGFGGDYGFGGAGDYFVRGLNGRVAGMWLVRGFLLTHSSRRSPTGASPVQSSSSALYRAGLMSCGISMPSAKA